MAIEDLWYRNAIIYCLDVSKFMDGNGDGVGDFAGLSLRLNYLAGLGVTCVWLLPFQRTPNRDNRYDVQDYYAVDPKHGTFGDFVECMNYAQSLGIRVVADLVVNHTSPNSTPGFKKRAKTETHRGAPGMSGPTNDPPIIKRGLSFRASRRRRGPGP